MAGSIENAKDWIMENVIVQTVSSEVIQFVNLKTYDYQGLEQSAIWFCVRRKQAMTDYNILNYGVKADGATNNRKAIQKAIDECTANGGGRVVVPSGKFLSGTLVLKSNVELYLESGAVLIGSIHQEDLIDFAKEFNDDNKDIGWEGGCFLCAFHEENISITGQGAIYGQGDKVFYDDNADEGFHECPLNLRTQLRPRTTFFEDIKNLVVKDITFKDAAFWTLHMAGCEHVIVNEIKILNDQRGANNDGIDPDTCKDVVISDCIIKAGDDAIVVKNSEPMAAKYGSCENIVISNCVLYSHDSALKIGTETFNAIRNVVLSNCVFRDCSRGVGIWVRDGATIEDIHIHHVSGNTKRYADCPEREFAPRWWGKGEPIFINATYRNANHKMPGKIRNITFDHIYMKCESSVYIAGEKDSRIKNISIHNINLTMEKQGTQPADFFDEQPSQRDVYPHAIPAVYSRCTDNLEIIGDIGYVEPYNKIDNKIYEIEDCSNVNISLKERA